MSDLDVYNVDNPVAKGNGSSKSGPPRKGMKLGGLAAAPGASFENEAEVNQAQLARAQNIRDERVEGHVMPESLETETGTDAVLQWKETLVEHAVVGKENARAKRKRLSRKVLDEGSLIDPEGRFRRKWDFMQMLFLIYVAFGVPYRLGFSQPVILWSPFFWFDLCVDIYFLADIAVSFRTAYYNEVGDLICEKEAIRKNYLRTWCVLCCFYAV